MSTLRESATSSPPFRVVLGLTSGELSGVDVFCFHLARALAAEGVPTHILLTKPNQAGRNAIALPTDLRFDRLRVGIFQSWEERWRALVGYLTALAPCVYLPNYDYAYSTVTPQLPGSVAVVGVVHSDDPAHYEHVERLGDSWDAVVAVSAAVASSVSQLKPALATRLTTIPYGIPSADAPPARAPRPGEPLRIAFAGRLVQHQKRVLDLAAVAHELARRGVPFEMRVAGDGEDRNAFALACGDLIRARSVRLLGTIPNGEVLREFERADAFVLTSEFEGLPISLLEAMGRGAVPVVSAIRSGVPEVVEDGVNGYLVPVGDVAGFVDRLERLSRNPELAASMSRAARARIAERYQVHSMVDRYKQVFAELHSQISAEALPRARGPFRPPAGLPAPWREHFPPVWSDFCARASHLVRDAARRLPARQAPIE